MKNSCVLWSFLYKKNFVPFVIDFIEMGLNMNKNPNSRNQRGFLWVARHFVDSVISLFPSEEIPKPSDVSTDVVPTRLTFADVGFSNGINLVWQLFGSRVYSPWHLRDEYGIRVPPGLNLDDLRMKLYLDEDAEGVGAESYRMRASGLLQEGYRLPCFLVMKLLWQEQMESPGRSILSSFLKRLHEADPQNKKGFSMMFGGISISPVARDRHTVFPCVTWTAERGWGRGQITLDEVRETHIVFIYFSFS